MSSFDLNANCTSAPAQAASDAGVAGLGILIAFMLSAFIALLLCTHVLFTEFRASKRPHTVARRILGGLSDQQIIQGIAIQAVGLARVNSMIGYHFFIIWMLSLLSTATNMAALLALVQMYQRDWLLRWLRQTGMFVNLGLSVVYGIFLLNVNFEQLASTLPIACVFRDHASDQDDRNNAASTAGTIAIIAVSGLVFIAGTWYLHRKQIWDKTVKLASLLLLWALAIAATVRIILIADGFGGDTGVPLSDRNEINWSFGQLVSMVGLIYPLITAIEIYRGDIKVPQNSKGSQETEIDQVPLVNSYR